MLVASVEYARTHERWPNWEVHASGLCPDEARELALHLCDRHPQVRVVHEASRIHPGGRLETVRKPAVEPLSVRDGVASVETPQGEVEVSLDEVADAWTRCGWSMHEIATEWGISLTQVWDLVALIEGVQEAA